MGFYDHVLFCYAFKKTWRGEIYSCAPDLAEVAPLFCSQPAAVDSNDLYDNHVKRTRGAILHSETWRW